LTELQMIYKASYDYLLQMLPEKITEQRLQDYFVGDSQDFLSLRDVFVQFIHSAQNYQRMPNVIKFDQRKEDMSDVLCDYDFYKIKDMDVDELYQILRKRYNIGGKDSKQNSWYKWSKSVVDAAKFMSEFKDVEDFKLFVDRFSYNFSTRMALPLLIEKKISGIGFALACDSLKELGYLDYPKPDVHIKEVFYQIGVAEKDDIAVFEVIDKMATECKEIDRKVSPYKIDKILWLICSGKFYKDDISIGQHRDELIQYIKEARVKFLWENKK
jgi:hypothetical protein